MCKSFVREKNGHRGYIKCYQEGESCKTAKVANGYTHIRLPTPKVRIEHMKTKKHALEAFKEDKLVYGVKYPTWLHRLKYFDLVDSVVIDYMHGFMLGVVKMMLKSWFSS